MHTSNDILFTEQSGLGIITLNRPQALNALTYEMVKQLYAQLIAWRDDATVKAILICANGERAFCAGGDIRSLYEAKQKNQPQIDFFWHEYRLNHLIHSYPKPYIAFLNGITMGGGVGVSEHGSHRIGTERLTFAMPETGIGFFPDVGGSYFLPRCPSEFGTYLALTGARINMADAYYLKLIDYFIPTEKLAAVVENLTELNFSVTASADAMINETLEKFSAMPEQSVLATHASMINKCFCFNSVEEIFQALEKQTDDWSVNTLKILRGKSPTALKITLEQIRRGKHLNFAECMQMEYRLVTRCLNGHDFYEGIRAAIIDKDQQPQWHPKNLADITAEDIEKYFAPLGKNDLHFD